MKPLRLAPLATVLVAPSADTLFAFAKVYFRSSFYLFFAAMIVSCAAPVASTRATGTPATGEIRSPDPTANTDQSLDEAIKQEKSLLDALSRSAPARAQHLFRLSNLHGQKADMYDNQRDALAERCSEGPDKEHRDCTSLEDLLVKAAVLRRKARSQRAEIIKRYPQFSELEEVYFQQGTSLILGGEPDKGLELFRHLIADYPKSRFLPDVLLAFGDFYFGKGDIPTALKAYKKVRVYPDSSALAPARYKEAWCYYLTDQGPKALDTFVQTLKLVETAPPDSGSADLTSRAREGAVFAFASFGAPDKAAAFFRKISGSEEEGWLMSSRLASLWAIMGNPADSTRLYRELVRQARQSVRSLYSHHGIVRNANRVEPYSKVALEEIVRLMKLVQIADGGGFKDLPNDWPAMRSELEEDVRGWATTYHRRARQGNDPEIYGMAYFLYKFYLETFSNSPEQYRMTVFYGELLYRLQKWGAAAAAFEKAAQLSPDGEYARQVRIGAKCAHGHRSGQAPVCQSSVGDSMEIVDLRPTTTKVTELKPMKNDARRDFKVWTEVGDRIRLRVDGCLKWRSRQMPPLQPGFVELEKWDDEVRLDGVLNQIPQVRIIGGRNHDRQLNQCLETDFAPDPAYRNSETGKLPIWTNRHKGEFRILVQHLRREPRHSRSGSIGARFFCVGPYCDDDILDQVSKRAKQMSGWGAVVEVPPCVRALLEPVVGFDGAFAPLQHDFDPWVAFQKELMAGDGAHPFFQDLVPPSRILVSSREGWAGLYADDVDVKEAFATVDPDFAHKKRIELMRERYGPFKHEVQDGGRFLGVVEAEGLLGGVCVDDIYAQRVLASESQIKAIAGRVHRQAGAAWLASKASKLGISKDAVVEYIQHQAEKDLIAKRWQDALDTLAPLDFVDVRTKETWKLRERAYLLGLQQAEAAQRRTNARQRAASERAERRRALFEGVDPKLTPTTAAFDPPAATGKSVVWTGVSLRKLGLNRYLMISGDIYWILVSEQDVRGRIVVYETRGMIMGFDPLRLGPQTLTVPVVVAVPLEASN